MFSKPLFAQVLLHYIAYEKRTWSSILGCLFSSLSLGCLIIFILLGIYNRYFHTLRHIPGPFWGSVTDFYKLCALVSQDVSQFSLELHQKYGPIVRVAPNMLSISDPLDVPQVYHRNCDKNDFWTPGALGEHPPLIQTIDHKEHNKKRKIMASVLSMKRLLHFEKKVDESVTRLQCCLQSRFVLPGKKLDLSKWARWYLYDTTMSLVFGTKMGFIDEGRDVNGLLGAFRRSCWFVGLLALFPYLINPIVKLPIVKRFALPHSGDRQGVGKIMKQRDILMEEFTTKNRQGLFRSCEKLRSTHSESLSNDDLNAELLMMMVAAPDTTSALICSVVNQVLQHPDVHKKLVLEITAATDAGELDQPVATFTQIKNLPFFAACIQESARLFPSIPVLLPRRVSKGGLVLKGFFIPEGTAIGASAAVVNRDPNVFGPDAEIFRPERWLEQSDRVAQMHRLIFSWGCGTRKCSGKSLALLETYKFCFQLLRGFELTSANPEEPSRKRENIGFAIYSDQFIYLKNRELIGDNVDSGMG